MKEEKLMKANNKLQPFLNSTKINGRGNQKRTKFLGGMPLFFLLEKKQSVLIFFQILFFPLKKGLHSKPD